MTISYNRPNGQSCLETSVRQTLDCLYSFAISRTSRAEVQYWYASMFCSLSQQRLELAFDLRLSLCHLVRERPRDCSRLYLSSFQPLHPAEVRTCSIHLGEQRNIHEGKTGALYLNLAAQPCRQSSPQCTQEVTLFFKHILIEGEVGRRRADKALLVTS